MAQRCPTSWSNVITLPCHSLISTPSQDQKWAADVTYVKYDKSERIHTHTYLNLLPTTLFSTGKEMKQDMQVKASSLLFPTYTSGGDAQVLNASKEKELQI